MLHWTPIMPQGDPLKIYQCGASLIDAGILLTAAHCLDGLRYLGIHPEI
jgi:hypothetical protein